MRRFLFLALALSFAWPAFGADCVWANITGASRSRTATGAVNCTLTPATATSSAGVNLSGVGAFAVEVCADSGQTITTAFSLSAYTYDPYAGLWMPAPDYNLTSTSTGSQCVSFGGWTVVSPAGRIAYAPSAGAVSSGSITIRITATTIAGDIS